MGNLIVTMSLVHQQYKCIVFKDCMYVAMYVCKNSEIILSKQVHYIYIGWLFRELNCHIKQLLISTSF